MIVDHAKTRDLYERFDVATDDLVRRAREEGATIPCGPGCSGCCASPAQATPFEIPLIIEAVRTMAPEMRAKIKRGLARWWRRLLEGGVDPRKADPPTIPYETARAVCPFLFEHKCSIYAVRPLACRGHYMVGPDPKVCSNRANEPNITVLAMGEGVSIAIMTLMRDAFADMDVDEFHVGVGLVQALVADAWPLVEQETPDYVSWVQAKLSIVR